MRVLGSQTERFELLYGALVQTGLSLEKAGIVLGAGTVVVPSEGERRLCSIEGREARVLALLSTAFGRPAPYSTLTAFERAARCWNAGDDALAAMHLALAIPNTPGDEGETAWRAAAAEELLGQGMAPATLLTALGSDPVYSKGIEKLYNPDQPRVPAGSGRESGQWTKALWALAARLAPTALRALATFAGRLGGPTIVFGSLFIPSSRASPRSGDVTGVDGLSFVFRASEATLYLNYIPKDGPRQDLTATLGLDEVFRTKDGRIVGIKLPDGALVLDPGALSRELSRDDEPRLCPAPAEDKVGGHGESGERARDFEDFVKAMLNPQAPTPRAFGVQLPNPQAGGKLVFFDDCQRATGMMAEMKGAAYGDMLAKVGFPQIRRSLKEDWLKQSASQLAAAGDRPLTWFFAEQPAADFARGLFDDARHGRERIRTIYVPWGWLRR